MKCVFLETEKITDKFIIKKSIKSIKKTTKVINSKKVFEFD